MSITESVPLHGDKASAPTARERILTATKSLVRDRPLDEVSVKEILSLSHCSRATFYKHFPDKQQILAEIFRCDLVDYNWFDYAKGWRERHQWFFEHLMADRQFYLNAMRTPEFTRAWMGLAVDANVHLLETVAADVQVSHARLVHFARFMSAGIVNDAMAWLADPGRLTAAELATRHALFVEYGLAGLLGSEVPKLIEAPITDGRATEEADIQPHEHRLRPEPFFQTSS